MSPKQTTFSFHAVSRWLSPGSKTLTIIHFAERDSLTRFLASVFFTKHLLISLDIPRSYLEFWPVFTELLKQKFEISKNRLTAVNEKGESKL
jgi:uncharacterized membrane protein